MPDRYFRGNPNVDGEPPAGFVDVTDEIERMKRGEGIDEPVERRRPEQAQKEPPASV